MFQVYSLGQNMLTPFSRNEKKINNTRTSITSRLCSDRYQVEIRDHNCGAERALQLTLCVRPLPYTVLEKIFERVPINLF